MAPGGLTPWALLVGAALAIVLRAPAYLTEPSFWAEEGALYFVAAWERPPREALGYRPAGYLLAWANLATALAAGLVRAGLLPLERAPQVTALFALVAQLLPVAVIAWSRAAFWGGPLRRAAGIAILLGGVLTDETWLSTVNSQPWLVLAAALLLLEPPAMGRTRAWAAAGVLAVAGLSAPAAGALLPLFAWRAWRARTGPALAQAGVLAACALVQVWCLWSAVTSGQPLPDRTAGLDLGVFAAVLWMRTLVAPLLGLIAAQNVGLLLERTGGLGPAAGVLLLALAGALVGWLAHSLRAEERIPLAGAYVLVTALTLLTAAGDKAMLLSTPWWSSRYAYTPGVLVLLMALGCVRHGAGRFRAAFCAVLLGLGLARGVADYRSSVLWEPWWPAWPGEVQAWEADPRRPLRIWPPPWEMGLRPVVQPG